MAINYLPYHYSSFYVPADKIPFVKRNPPAPKYRHLEKGEVAKEGDEFSARSSEELQAPFKYSGWVKSKSTLGTTVDSSTFGKFRREIRMQDKEHRYLDVGEVILDGDETLSEYYQEWKDALAVGLRIGEKNSQFYTFNQGTNKPFLYRRKITAAQPVVIDDKQYIYLGPGEITQEGDEVELNGGHWEKCRNGNIGAVVSSFQAKNRVYRRPKTVPGNVAPNFTEVDRLNLKLADVYAVNELMHTANTNLKSEVETLKDQLANAMAELNELKAKAKPKYVYLQEGELLKASDEFFSHTFQDWRLTNYEGARVGDAGTVGYLYRRKVSQ